MCPVMHGVYLVRVLALALGTGVATVETTIETAQHHAPAR